MSRGSTRLAVLLGVALTACAERGVDVGTEDLCAKDPRLVAAEQRAFSETVSTCAEIGENQLQNAGFEAPLVSSCSTPASYCYVPADEVPGWRTNSADQVIEIWLDGHNGIPAAEGSQFAELDARSRDTLSQDFMLPAGQLMYWSILHRGRSGIESLELQLGAPGTLVTQATLSSAEDSWYEYSGLYRTGAEPITRLALVSRTGSDEGNLVDAVVFAPVD